MEPDDIEPGNRRLGLGKLKIIWLRLHAPDARLRLRLHGCLSAANGPHITCKPPQLPIEPHHADQRQAAIRDASCVFVGAGGSSPDKAEIPLA
jgi:hypothetical protein